MKRHLALLTAIFVLTGCGPVGSSEDKSSTKETTADATTTSTTAPEETTPLEATISTEASTTTAHAETEAISTTNEKGQTEFEVYYKQVRSFLKSETVNGICVGTTFDQVQKLFGKPDKLEKEDPDHQDGILQRCFYDKLEPKTEDDPEYGVEIILERIDGVQSVREFNFYVTAETKSGVKIGSPRSEVIAAYEDKGLTPDLDSVSTIPDEEWRTIIQTATLTDKYPLAVGHWKWGEMLFKFDENDNVSCIHVCSGTCI